MGPRDRVDRRLSPFPCSPGRLPEGGEIWAVGPGPSHLSWPGLCQCSHPCVPIPWKNPFLGPARCTHGSCHFLTFPGPPYTSQRTGSPQNKKHFQVVRTRARAWLIGSETSSEQWPRRKLGRRNAHHPHCFWQRSLFLQSHSPAEASLRP